MTPTLWFDAAHTRAAASVMMLTRDGRLILQLRDDIPGIDNPGMVTSFGGAAETGETPLACALRELAEETGLSADPAALRLLGAISKRDFRGNNTACVFYVLRDVNPASLAITEGTAVLLSPEEVATDVRVTPVCRDMAARLARVFNTEQNSFGFPR